MTLSALLTPPGSALRAVGEGSSAQGEPRGTASGGEVGRAEELPSPSVPGVTLRRAGESLETVSTKSGEFSLLASPPGLEVQHGRLGEGKRLTLVPFDPGSEIGTEFYYILSGEMSADLPTGTLVANAGDVIVVHQLEAPTIFLARSEVRFLYATNLPSFHQISGRLRELMRLATEVERKDGYTAQHCLRLQQLSYATGKELGLAHHRLRNLSYGAYLHDVGKARLPVELLLKPGALTAEEWTEMKKHPTYGRQMLDETFMKPAGAIVEQHHERRDGSGYPLGLRGDEILVESSIVAVADTYDAMTTDRPYRKGASPETAMQELAKFAGRHYPAEVVDAFAVISERLTELPG